VYSSINAEEQDARRMVPDKNRSMSKYSYYALFVLGFAEIKIEKRVSRQTFASDVNLCSEKWTSLYGR